MYYSTGRKRWEISFLLSTNDLTDLNTYLEFVTCDNIDIDHKNNIISIISLAGENPISYNVSYDIFSTPVEDIVDEANVFYLFK